MSSARAVWDVIVVGAGPGGSTTATLMAEAGFRVLVLERDRFPRFHIGESLLPAGVAVHDRLGLDHPPEDFTFKAGAEFVCERSGRAQRFAFAEALPGPPRSAWQVERARFDTRLRDCALAAGAEVRHGEKVTEVAIDADGVSVVTGSGRERGRFLVDATGQDRLLARKGRTVEPYRRFGKAAVYTHYSGLTDAALAEIGAGNDIRIMVLEHGWGWLIPLPGRRLSVGVVTQQSGVDTGLVDAAYGGSDLLARWTDGATRGETGVARNFSYRNTAPSGPRFACVGDAACFLDPVFSSGVALAMLGAERLAAALGPALASGTEARADLMAPLNAHNDRGSRVFGAMIDRFYNTRFADNVFLSESPDGVFRRGIISVLAGDVWRDDNPFQALLERARRGRRSAAQA